METTPVGLEGGVMEMAITSSDDGIRMNIGDTFDASVMKLNTSREKLLDNIRTNLRWQLPQVVPADATGQICIVGGGWSLKDKKVYDELRQLYFSGAKIVAVNGSAKWLMERNLRPSVHVVLDARPENIEFIREPLPRCKLLLASQCHLSLFDLAQDRDTFIFHAIGEEADEEISLIDSYYGKGHWLRIPPCSTAGVTTIALMRILGFTFQHLFGIDSCFDPNSDDHHAYPQALNEGEDSALFQVGSEGRVFRCSAWQAAQARSFLDLIQVNGQFLELSVHGDGLLAYLIEKAAAMPLEEI